MTQDKTPPVVPPLPSATVPPPPPAVPALPTISLDDLIAAADTPKKKNTTAKQKMLDKYLEKRNKIWPILAQGNPAKERVLWEFKGKGGFVNIPKAMPLVFKIMGSLSSGSSITATYLALWCRDYGTGYFEIGDLDSLALEAGFTGTRATGTLNGRIKILNELGFIRAKKTSNGKYRSILMLNPMLVIYLLNNDGRINPAHYEELVTRCIDLGDKDFNKFESKGVDGYKSIISSLG